MNILRTKSIEQSIKDTEDPEFQLRNKNEEELANHESLRRK
jgi:hypothetical protein